MSSSWPGGKKTKSCQCNDVGYSLMLGFGGDMGGGEKYVGWTVWSWSSFLLLTAPERGKGS